MFSTGF